MVSHRRGRRRGDRLLAPSSSFCLLARDDRAAGDTVLARERSRVAVAPIDFSSEVPGRSYLAAGMQGELVGILAEFDWLIVFPIIADKAINKAPQDLKERVDYIVRMTAQAANGKLAVWALLTEAKTGAVLWSNRYERPMDTLELVELQRNIASRIASDVARSPGRDRKLGKDPHRERQLSHGTGVRLLSSRIAFPDNL